MKHLLQLFPQRSVEAKAYADFLATAGVERGLIGPREVERLWERHIYNSLLVTPFLAEGASVADIGSGAGLPGIPIALARPDLKMTLVEPLLRRANFLIEFRDSQSLDFEVLRCRGEELTTTYHHLTARAVAPLTRLLPLLWPALKPGGSLVLLKGENLTQELADAKAVLARIKPVEISQHAPLLEGEITGKILVLRK